MTQSSVLAAGFAAMFMACGFSSVQAFAADRCWTAVPSAGVVDEGDIGLFIFDLNTAAVRSTRSVGTVDLHFSIAAVDGIFGLGKILTARIADNGANARVIVKVRRTNISTGVTSTHTTIDSDALGLPTTGAHTVAQSFGEGGGDFFDFKTNVYWVDVQLIKLNTGGNPRVEALQICANNVT